VVVVDLATVVAAFKAAGSMATDKLHVVLAPVEAASALAACAAPVAVRTLRAQDLAFLHLGVHRTRSLS
jgi:hypothetical protein